MKFFSFRRYHESYLTVHNMIRHTHKLQQLQVVLHRGIASSRLKITKISDDNSHFQSKPCNTDLKFGTTFSDHMLTIEYKMGSWQDPQIVPYQNLSISPAASSLHYGLSCFEGMKAYKSTIDNDETNHDKLTSTIRLFRPDKNMERLKNSMERLEMPGYDFDPQELLTLMKTLIRLDEKWIPEGDGYSLYLRPTVVATHPYLGLAAPTELLLYVITCPVGPYYPSGFRPVTLWATPSYVRAWPGGTGSNKVGGNYAPTMKPQAEAMKRGYSQVLWLFGDNHEVTEVGSMNVFFVFQDDDDGSDILVTPPLTRGDILPGVTRDSILHLAKLMGLKTEERFPTMKELQHACTSNRLVEAFGAGTAAVVTPIEGIHYEGTTLRIPATGKWTQRFWDELTGIQSGRRIGPDGWSVLI
jgi:branched-chain amino acid aminotransferase